MTGGASAPGTRRGRGALGPAALVSLVLAATALLGVLAVVRIAMLEGREIAVLDFALEQGETARRMLAVAEGPAPSSTPEVAAALEEKNAALRDVAAGTPAGRLDDGDLAEPLGAVAARAAELSAAVERILAVGAGDTVSPTVREGLADAATAYGDAVAVLADAARTRFLRSLADLRRVALGVLAVVVLLVLLGGARLLRAFLRRGGRERRRHGGLDRELDPRRIGYLARYDSLTGLINRTLFADRLQGALARARRDGGLVAVMFLDVDDFKQVNDRYGHATGDALLRQVAERLVGSVRESDTVARLGGDEFTIILEGGHRVEDAGRVATKILAALGRPYRIGHRELRVTTSIGIAIYPVDGEDAEEILRGADIAMYSAKEAGRNTYQYFTRELRERTGARLAFIDGLRHAVTTGEGLDVVYLPTVDLEHGRVTSLEALLRWTDPELGPVPPNRFIPLAEETDLILPLGEWVLDRVCAQMRDWLRSGVLVDEVAVNVSARQFRHGNLVETVATALAVADLDPRRLSIDVAESVFAGDPVVVRRALERLRELGVRAVIDDFGTGSVSLGALSRLPVTGVKIDRSFVGRLPDPEAAAVVSAAISLASHLGLEPVAEGVETAAQRAFLERARCRKAQGFLLGGPLRADEVPGYLERFGVTFPGLPVR